MLYKIAHILRDKLPWIWDVISIINSFLFGLRYGDCREFRPEPSTDTVLVILLEITICTEVIAYKYRHDFTFRKPSLTISTTFTIAVVG